MKISSAGPLKESSAPVAPDFTIFTSAMEADPSRENVVRMIGSSTERDLHGDTMALSALTDMSQVEPGLIIWLNHEYFLPESLFGSLLEKPELRLQGGIADLHIVCDVETSNPSAVQTYGYIKKGKRLGCSIGCMVTEYEIDEENDDGSGWWPPIIMLHVLTLEWSVVGIPANQRSWTETATKGLFERMAGQGRGDEALRLAPAVKGLYPQPYEDYLKTVNNEALRKDLERVEARPTFKERVEWVPNERTFVMNRRGTYKSLDRKEIPAILAKGAVVPRYLGLGKESTEGTVVKSTEEIAIDAAMALIPDSVAVDDPLTEKWLKTPETLDENDDEKSVEPEKETDPIEHETPLATLSNATRTPCITEAIPLLPADVQLFNLLAERLGQSPISLDAQGQVQTVKAAPELSLDAIQEAIAKALDFGETIKSGNQFNKKNQQTLQSLHNNIVDMCKSQFHPCEEMDDGSDDGDGDGDEQKQFSAELLTVNPREAEQELTRLLVEQSAKFDTFIDVLGKHGIDPKAIKEMQGQITAEQRRVKDLQATARAAEERLAKLQNAPLGQPTLLKRGIQQNGDTVTHQDFARLALNPAMNDNERRWSLEDALEQTVVVPRTLAGGDTLNYRKWPDGVGGSVKDGVRPELKGSQRAWMHPSEMLSYNDGNEAFVPCYDDPGGVTA